MPGVEAGERPFLDRCRFGDRLAERRTGHEVKAGAGADPDQLAIPFDEQVVGIARKAEIVVEITRLRRNEVADVARLPGVLDIVELRARVEKRVGGEVRVRLAGRLQVRRVWLAEAAPLSAKRPIGRIPRPRPRPGFGRRLRPGAASDREYP